MEQAELIKIDVAGWKIDDMSFTETVELIHDFKKDYPNTKVTRSSLASYLAIKEL